MIEFSTARMEKAGVKMPEADTGLRKVGSASRKDREGELGEEFAESRRARKECWN